MGPFGWDDARLTLHVLAATVWVGGQFTLAALVPVLRRYGPGAVRPAARRFAAVAWVAFAVLVATGAWNVAAGWDRMDSAGRATLAVKVGVVGISGAAAGIHQRAQRPVTLAVFGAVSAVAAVLALLLGVVLAG